MWSIESVNLVFWRSGWVRLVLIMAALTFCREVCLQAQETSIIQGHISDAQGASVPKALVKVTHESTGVSRSAFTAEDGYYRIPDLLPGIYQARVELSGFKTIVKNDVEVTTKSVTGLNFMLEVGEVTETVTVSGEEAQVETQIARISEVVGEREINSLPVQGRGILLLTMMSPGITGKPETTGRYCCDVFSNFAAPPISSGGNEVKANFVLDGINMRYNEGSSWAMAFSPNPDAVAEIRVSANPDSAEFGTMSGPQVRLTTKGGTNNWHGTAHYTTNQDEFNAVPFGSRREDIPNTYTRLFGGTAGGPILKDRLFVFGAYEGLHAKEARSTVVTAETEAFRDFVVATRPNSVAANVLNSYRPFRYPTSGLVDLGSPLPGINQWSSVPDGIPDLGSVTLDRPIVRSGKQFNGRVDYHSPSANDRIFGSYWYTRPEFLSPTLREAFDIPEFNRVQYQSLVYSHSFSPNILNETRYGHTTMAYIGNITSGAVEVPAISTDDGISLGSGAWSDFKFATNVNEFGNVLSINRGRHGIKVGGAYRRSSIDLQALIANEVPAYSFSSILDFADDEPYREARTFNLNSDRPAGSKRTIFPISQEVSFFVSNTWQMRPNLTLNYGFRYENFFSNWLGKGRNNFQPVLSSEQLTSNSVATVINQKVDRFYNSDKNNFSPRLGVAWDPSGKGKISIRAGFAILYDEFTVVPIRDYNSFNPPDTADVAAGVQEGIPIVYGLAPAGTRDFPVNPNLLVQDINSAGGFDGQRVSLGAVVTDLKSPMIYDVFGGVQYQLTNDLMIHADYKHRRSNNDGLVFDANRFAGDLVDGRLDRLNPNWNSVRYLTNLGRRRYHGLILGASKRFSQGWQLSANYTYNYGKNNYAAPDDQYGEYGPGLTEAFNASRDWARDDIAHVFTLHNVWEIPILRGRSGWWAGLFGGWQLNTIWYLQSGPPFFPTTDRLYGEGGDFNADGQAGERPDRPTEDVAHSFSKREWLNGALSASLFPLPATSDIRPGNLPRDFFRGPGYARVDAAFVKAFPVPIGRAEKARLQVRVEAFDLFNRINISSISNSLDDPVNFGRATGAYPMRVLQLSVKFLF